MSPDRLAKSTRPDVDARTLYRWRRRPVPGGDHVVMTGARSVQRRTIHATPAPIEMPNTHEANTASDTRPACAAWTKLASGPENDTRTAGKPDPTPPSGQGSHVVQDVPGRSETFTVLDCTAANAFQVIEIKAHHRPGADIASYLSKEDGYGYWPVDRETIMNSSMNNDSTHRLLAASRINRSVLLGVCLIALTAILFYGPVLLLLWRELR
jgi:hypothetical protein